MAASSMKASFMAIIPTPGARYQQACPRRVSEASIMSSDTRKKACSSSVSQPSVAVAVKLSGDNGLVLRMEAVSITDMPRLYLPPKQLYLRL